MKRCLIFFLIPLLLAPAVVGAKTKKDALLTVKNPAGQEVELPASLDYDRRNAVNHRLEFSPYGGDYFGDKLNHTFITGADLTFNLSNMLGVVGNFSWSRASVDRTSALGAVFHDKNEWIWDGGFVVNMPAVFRSKNSLVECDLYTTIGAGVLSINGSSHVGGFLGGGMKIRPNVRWLAIRVDIRNYFTSIDNPGGSNFEDDFSVRIGPTFLIPPEL